MANQSTASATAKLEAKTEAINAIAELLKARIQFPSLTSVKDETVSTAATLSGELARQVKGDEETPLFAALEKRGKEWSKQAKDKVGQWLEYLATFGLSLFNTDELEGNATYSNGVTTVTVDRRTAVTESTKALFLSLARADDNKIIEATKKKNGKARKMFFEDSESFGGESGDLKLQDEIGKGTATAQFILYDSEEKIPTAIRLIARAAQAIDENRIYDAAEIIGSLIGADNIPNPHGFKFDDGVVCALVEARITARCSIAARKWLQELREKKAADVQKAVEAAHNGKPLVNESVIKDRIANAQAEAVKPDVPINVDEARAQSIANLKREVKAENERLAELRAKADGKPVSEKRLLNLLTSLGTLHGDHSKVTAQFEGGTITKEEYANKVVMNGLELSQAE